ncbi:MAG: hypothetical protein R2911_44060 [Caldilineaceae bacterium]
MRQCGQDGVQLLDIHVVGQIYLGSFQMQFNTYHAGKTETAVDLGQRTVEQRVDATEADRDWGTSPSAAI